MLFSFLGYWFVPLVTLPFWARGLCRRDWIITGTHIALLFLLAWSALAFHYLAVITLRHDSERLSDWVTLRSPAWYKVKVPNIATALLCGGVFLWFSMSAFNGVPRERYIPHRDSGPRLAMFNPRRWVPRVLEEVGFRPFVNFDDTDVSVKPANWVDRYANITPSPYQNVAFDRRMTQPLDADNTEIAQVKPAQLKGSDLRYANARRAFLVRADLRNAVLDNASAMYCDLRGANIRNSSLRNADLDLALISRADMSYSNLQKLSLAYADLRDTDFRGADLEGAFLVEANMTGAILSSANFSNADLTSADLRNCSMIFTNFSGADLRQANLEKVADTGNVNFRGAKLMNADLRGSDFAGADFTDADLAGADLRGTDLRGAIWTGTNGYGAIYDKNTKWPVGFIPRPLPISTRKRTRVIDPARGY